MTVQRKPDYNWLIGTALTVLCIVASSFLVFGQDKQRLDDTTEMAKESMKCIEKLEDKVDQNQKETNKVIGDLSVMIHKLDITLTKLEAKLE